MSNHSSASSLNFKSAFSSTITTATSIISNSFLMQHNQQIYQTSVDLNEVFSKLNFNNNEKDNLTVRRGRCKWFNVAKGWGFITPIGGGPEVFVHQSVIQMTGFRSLGEQEEVEYECKMTERGLEATRVTGNQGIDCHGSTCRPYRNIKKRFRRVRCYNCGEFANHIAAKCELGPQPKRCHQCKQEDHLFANCAFRNPPLLQQLINQPLAANNILGNYEITPTTPPQQHQQ